MFYLKMFTINPIALTKAKIVYNFSLSECNRVNPKLSLVPLICSNAKSLIMTITTVKYLEIPHICPYLLLAQLAETVET